MSEEQPGRFYLEALARELSVGRRYRRRALAEIADHIDEVCERERHRGASAEEAERIALLRLGAVEVVAGDLSIAWREAVMLARVRALRLIAVFGAVLVVACASLAGLVLGGSDEHLGAEAVSAVCAALALMLIDGRRRGFARVGALLLGVIVVWIAVSAVLISDGDVAYCGSVLLAVSGTAALAYGARRLSVGMPRRRL